MHYRTYLLTGNDPIQSGQGGDYASDADAFAALRGAIGDAPAAELWCGNRCVGLVTAEEVRGKQALSNAEPVISPDGR